MVKGGLLSGFRGLLRFKFGKEAGFAEKQVVGQSVLPTVKDEPGKQGQSLSLKDQCGGGGNLGGNGEL
jgi:hypothetical protein